MADAEKELGNAEFKVGNYEKAIETLPDEMSYYNNLAAVKYEQKEYEAW